MRALLLATPILAGVLISSSLAAQADKLAGAPIVDVQPRTAGAPVQVQPRAAGAPVHVQPRAKDFYPHSPAREVEQERLSTFDAKQQKLDSALNKKLSICRC